MPLKEKIPNQMLYMVLLTAHDILGENAVKSVLNFAHLQNYINNYPPNDLNEEHSIAEFSRLMAGLVDLLGERGARAIMFRGGVRGFEIFHEQFPSLMNIEGITPEERSDDKMFEEFMRIYGIMVDASVPLWGDVFKYYPCEEGAALEISPCQYCVGLKTKDPICSAQVGFQFGVLRWILGKEVKVEETHCIATGDPMCRFVMHRP
jgi:predicted hydrocarbon binding protein